MRTLAAAFVVGLFLAIAPQSAAQGGPRQFVLTWGSYGVGPGLFDRPVAVAANSVGEVYVGDSRQSYIQRFSPDGHLLGMCLNQGEAIALAVDPRTDRVFASDPHGLGVQVYSRDLVHITGWNGSPWGGVGVAYGIAIGPTGDLYIAGGAGHSIARWTQDGSLIQRWADPGPGPGQLRSAWGIAVDAAGFVYVSEYAGSRVVKFTADGQYVTAWGSLGSGPGQFASPTNIGIDPTGIAVVADPYNDRIEEFTLDGGFLAAWGTPGQAAGQLDEPYGVTVSGSNVYVADASNSRIQKFGYLPTAVRRATWGSVKILYR